MQLVVEELGLQAQEELEWKVSPACSPAWAFPPSEEKAPLVADLPISQAWWILPVAEQQLVVAELAPGLLGSCLHGWEEACLPPLAPHRCLDLGDGCWSQTFGTIPCHGMEAAPQHWKQQWQTNHQMQHDTGQ